jgi:uncharacterized protein
MMWIIYAVPAVVVSITILILYMFWYEPSNFKLSEADIFISDNNIQNESSRQSRSKGSPPKTKVSPLLTILHLSDFHLRKNSKGRKLFQFVRGLEKLEPDFIFITGDLVESNRNIDYLVEMLSPLRAKSGKYVILGVHDHYEKAFTEFAKNMFKKKRAYMRENDIQYLGSKLKDIGVEILLNERRSHELGEKGIDSVEIIGLDDPVINRIDINKAFPDSYNPGGNKIRLRKGADYKKAYRSVFALSDKKVHRLNEKGKLRLVLLHTPDSDSIIELAGRKTDIIFCGHTHGGQVRLPLVGAVISGCNIKTKFASGLFYFKNIVLFVTRGLGEGKYSQFRFYCQPEANLIRIYKTD